MERDRTASRTEHRCRSRSNLRDTDGRARHVHSDVDGKDELIERVGDIGVNDRLVPGQPVAYRTQRGNALRIAAKRHFVQLFAAVMPAAAAAITRMRRTSRGFLLLFTEKAPPVVIG